MGAAPNGSACASSCANMAKTRARRGFFGSSFAPCRMTVFRQYQAGIAPFFQLRLCFCRMSSMSATGMYLMRQRPAPR